VVLTWKSDRLFRSLSNFVATVTDLGEMGVAFASVTEPIDSSSASGRLVMNIMATLAEFERSLIRERTVAGMAAARRRGARIGRPRVQYDLDRVLDMREAGASIRAIASAVGVSVPVIHAALRQAGVSKGAPKTCAPAASFQALPTR
jgi:DNA invertase Pin-like site-specific DNA recombinase